MKNRLTVFLVGLLFFLSVIKGNVLAACGGSRTYTYEYKYCAYSYTNSQGKRMYKCVSSDVSKTESCQTHSFYADSTFYPPITGFVSSSGNIATYCGLWEDRYFCNASDPTNCESGRLTTPDPGPGGGDWYAAQSEWTGCNSCTYKSSRKGNCGNATDADPDMSFCSTNDMSSADKCNSGSYSAIDGVGDDGQFNWRCNGSCGGSDSSVCTATRLFDVNGVCGSANGGYFTTTPTSNLCNSGTASNVTFYNTTTTITADPVIQYTGTAYTNKSTCSAINGYCGDFSSTPSDGATCKVTGSIDYGIIYTGMCGGDSTVKCCSPNGAPALLSTTYPANSYAWTCNGQCSGNTTSCLAYLDVNVAPTLSSLAIKNSVGTSITAENNKNHICQSFFNDKVVTFEATFTDDDGNADINYGSARLRLGSNTYGPPRLVSRSGNNVVVAFDFTSDSTIPNGLNTIELYVADNSGSNTGWVNNGRSFKFWDCQVPVSGSFFDGSTGQICPNFSSALATDANFKSLTFISPGSGLSSIMTINSNPTYNDGGNKLTWGAATYVADLNADLAASGISLRLIDLGIGTTRTCSSTLSFTLDNNTVDPYASVPSLRADFSATVDQDSWFQAINSGILGKNIIRNYIPVTCIAPSCTSAMSIGGLISAPIINNTSDIPHSSPNNWWYSGSSLVSQINYYEKFKSLGIGETVNGDLDDLVDKNGLVLVNGNININQDKTVGVGGFLMLVASGDITIAPEVTMVEGVLVGRNINIGGTNSNQLVINGSLYGTNEVKINRSYTDKKINNTSPAVKVNLRPDFIFKIPSEISNKVTNWKWGN